MILLIKGIVSWIELGFLRKVVSFDYSPIEVIFLKREKINEGKVNRTFKRVKKIISYQFSWKIPAKDVLFLPLNNEAPLRRKN
jgi:phospholipid N-methyltransferase